jgi:hypothetical protein
VLDTGDGLADEQVGDIRMTPLLDP